MFYDLTARALDAYVDFLWFPLTGVCGPWIIWAVATIFLKKKMSKYAVAAAFFLSASISIFAFASSNSWVFYFDRNDYGILHGAVEAIGILGHISAMGIIMAFPTASVFIWLYSKGRCNPN